MPSKEARDLAAARRVTDHHRAFEIKVLEEREQVVGVRIHLIAVPRLAGAPVSAAVMRDTAVAALRQKKHLRLEGIAAQRPAVAERNDRARPPIFIVNLRAVLNRDVWHGCPFPVVPRGGELVEISCETLNK
jgi:hypothetical protein